ncbi:MAG: signal peptidase I [Armatimonadetes bacterium]|nr:signal peptidase I [Armatimonadota bacterium]
MRKLVLPLVTLLLAWRLVNPASLAVVEGSSMEPTLRNGQVFVIDRLHYRHHSVAPGDVVAFRHGSDIYIKRVAAVAGQAVYLLVDPQTGAAEAIPPETAAWLSRPGMRRHDPRRLARVVVPPGHMYVMGDHRSVSYDSRDFGPVPLAMVIGRARW